MEGDYICRGPHAPSIQGPAVAGVSSCILMLLLEEFCCNVIHLSVVLFLNFTYCIIIYFKTSFITVSMQSVIHCHQKKRMRDTHIRIFHMCIGLRMEAAINAVKLTGASVKT